jgi:hypothetical protein
MSLRNFFRKILLCIALGGHPIFGAGMRQEKIEELLHAMNKTKVEVSIDDVEDWDHSKVPPGRCPESALGKRIAHSR